MVFNSHNQSALVMGGNKGIGFAICQGLLKAGFEVILAARSLDSAKDAIDKL
jgi:NAD(P)-dependent dehydrogenase (short-subunit alcohol dehydrogenase family)